MATDLVRRAQSVLASLPMVTELGRVDRLTGFVVEGRVRFFGPVEEARTALASERLEDLFFRATEAGPPGDAPA